MLKKSVASITCGLTKMVAQLERHAEAQEAARATHIAKEGEFRAKANEAHAEAQKARHVAEKINRLVSDD